jgi:hypothetical protein
VFSCDLCKGEYREAPHPTQRDSTTIQVPGIGPVDQPLGNTTRYNWNDLCPDCTTQLRDAMSKIVEARKGRLDVTVNDSTRSPKTEEIERAKREGIEEERERAEKKIEKAKNMGLTRERDRVNGILEGEIASQETILGVAKKNGDADQESLRLTLIELLRRITDIVKSGQGQRPLE